VFEAVNRSRQSVLVDGLAMASVLALITASFVDQNRGHPADWFSAVIFLAAALAASRRYFIDGASIGRPAWALAALRLLASVFVVDAGPDRYQDLGTLKLNVRLLILGAGTVLMCGIGTLLPRSDQRGAFRADVAAVSAVAVFAIFGTGLFLVYWLTQVLALGVYLLILGREIGPQPSGQAWATVGASR
jgi:hypothetical protein